MARKCGACGQAGHNKRTCPALKGNLGIRLELVRPEDTDCTFVLGQRVAVRYPWADKDVVGTIDKIDYVKANVYLHDEQSNKSHGFNWRTLDEYKIRIEQLAHGKKVKRRRRRTQKTTEEKV